MDSDGKIWFSILTAIVGVVIGLIAYIVSRNDKKADQHEANIVEIFKELKGVTTVKQCDTYRGKEAEEFNHHTHNEKGEVLVKK